MGIPSYTLTEDGIEAHFSSNYLGFFLLFQLLRQSLLASVSSSFHSRVVVVSSSAQRAGTIPASDNYNFERSEYAHDAAYNNAKLAAVYLANHIDRLYGGQGLHATSLHPGAINTNISRNLPSEALNAILNNPYILKIMKSVEQGAATTVWAAVGTEWAKKGGKYLEDCKEAERGEENGQVFGVGYVNRTYSPTEEARLWQDSLKITGLEKA